MKLRGINLVIGVASILVIGLFLLKPKPPKVGSLNIFNEFCKKTEDILESFNDKDGADTLLMRLAFEIGDMQSDENVGDFNPSFTAHFLPGFTSLQTLDPTQWQNRLKQAAMDAGITNWECPSFQRFQDHYIHLKSKQKPKH